MRGTTRTGAADKACTYPAVARWRRRAREDSARLSCTECEQSSRDQTEHSEQLQRVNYIMSLCDREASEQSGTCARCMCAITKHQVPRRWMKVEQRVRSRFKLVKSDQFGIEEGRNDCSSPAGTSWKWGTDLKLKSVCSCVRVQQTSETVRCSAVNEERSQR